LTRNGTPGSIILPVCCVKKTSTSTVYIYVCACRVLHKVEIICMRAYIFSMLRRFTLQMQEACTRDIKFIFIAFIIGVGKPRH
jgi:hypothetical protein